MKKLDKILLFICSLICLVCSVCLLSLFYTIPYVSEAIEEYLLFYPWLHSAFAMYNSLICFCFALLLLISIFFPTKTSTITLKRHKGKLQFSKQTIESTVRYSYADMSEINFSTVKAKINKHPEKTKIYVKFSINDPSQLVDLTSTIQERIESSMKSAFGISVQTIHLEVVEVNSGKTVHDEGSRVI